MAKRPRQSNEVESSDETEVVTVDVFPEPPTEALPAGLKELPDGGGKGDPKSQQMEAAVKDGWERRIEEDKDHPAKGKGSEQWINRRDFRCADGSVVPQGVIRPLEEAYALECQRCG